MRAITLLTTLSIFTCTAFAQSNAGKFKSLLASGDTAAIKLLLTDWEKKAPFDPELYTAAFNFYFSESKEESIAIQQSRPNADAMQVKDNQGNVVAYLGVNLQGYNPIKLATAFRYINTGIQKFPDRLDMRLGKCFVLGQIQDYHLFTKEIIITVEQSKINGNKWFWTNNEKKKDGEKVLLSAVQDYLKELYDTENDELLDNMIQIGTKTLQYYPNHIEILSTTAVALLLKKDYDKAITYLKQAEKLDPKDFIVLNNIAHAYKLKGDKENAIRYYELTEKYGDDRAKAEAKENIRQLKK